MESDKGFKKCKEMRAGGQSPNEVLINNCQITSGMLNRRDCAAI